MRLLLDTNIVLWVTMNSSRLPKGARHLIDDAEAVFVSAISVWEIAIKAAIRGFDADANVVVSGVVEAGFQELSVRWSHARAVRDLPLHHRDPFDRMLVARSVVEPLQLVTSDRLLKQYGATVTVV